VSLNSNHLTALLENLLIMSGSTNSPPRITRMMALIVGTFCICWFPFAIMFMKFPFNFNQFEPDCGCPTNSSITVNITNIPPTCPPLDRELICEDPELDKFYFSEYLLEHSLIIEAITWLGYINSSLNPIIYAFMKADIKTGLLSMVGRGRQK